MKMRGISPNSYVFCEAFVYSHDQSAYSAAGKYVDRSWEYINRKPKTHVSGFYVLRKITNKYCCTKTQNRIPFHWIDSWGNSRGPDPEDP